jgi:hypothetical protein
MTCVQVPSFLVSGTNEQIVGVPSSETKSGVRDCRG